MWIVYVFVYCWISFLNTCISVEAGCIYQKFTDMKWNLTTDVTMTMSGSLSCESACVKYGLRCLAVNVVTSQDYVMCEMFESFPANTTDGIVAEPGARLLVKTGVDVCLLNPCLYGGVCSQSGNHGYRCQCPSGYTGSRCEEDLVDQCEPSPCENNSTCVDLGTTYRCLCANWTTGETCQTDVTDECGSGACLAGGTCTDLGDSFSCVCPSWSTGTRCETDVSDDCSSAPCQNGGSCVDEGAGYSCTCGTGYLGNHCQTEDLCVTTAPCQNSGTCLFNETAAVYTCVCVPEYTGVHCEVYCAIGSLQGAVQTIGSPLVADVYVEMAHYGGQWIVLMRRQDGSVDFVNQLWADYRDGFGDLTGEFWLGNEVTHQLTNNGSTWTLRIDMRSFAGECRFAEYSSFSLGPESDFYRLHLSGYSGDAGDALTATSPSYGYHDGRRFQATDNKDRSTVDTYKGAWWYTYGGYYGKLTGYYGSTPSWSSIICEVWLGNNPLQYADMKMRVN